MFSISLAECTDTKTLNVMRKHKRKLSTDGKQLIAFLSFATLFWVAILIKNEFTLPLVFIGEIPLVYSVILEIKKRGI